MERVYCIKGKCSSSQVDSPKASYPPRHIRPVQLCRQLSHVTLHAANTATQDEPWGAVHDV